MVQIIVISGESSHGDDDQSIFLSFVIPTSKPKQRLFDSIDSTSNPIPNKEL